MEDAAINLTKGSLFLTAAQVGPEVLPQIGITWSQAIRNRIADWVADVLSLHVYPLGRYDQAGNGKDACEEAFQRPAEDGGFR